MDKKKILEQRILKHPEDKYLLKLYKYRIISIKVLNDDFTLNRFWIYCYLNKKNPLSWLYIFLQSLKQGLIGFNRAFEAKWYKIKNSHYLGRLVEVNDNDKLE